MSNLVQISHKAFTSRSAVLSYKTCPYKRFLTYHIKDSGVISEKQSLDLLIGSVVHRGLQHLFEHCRKEHPDGNFEEACVDEAVEAAKELWQDKLSKQSLWLHSGEEDRLDWIIAEQECLWEGLIRAFAIYKLPGILEEYDILEVEHEEVSESFSPLVTFLGKADGLFLRKSDKKLVILSIKTTSEYADVTERDILHDMQGVSEWFLIQERINTINDLMFSIKKLRGTELQYSLEKEEEIREHLYSLGSDNLLQFISDYQNANEGKAPQIFAVQYEYLIKGKRKQWPNKSGNYMQYSFLCHPLKLDSVVQIAFGRGGAVTIDPAKYHWNWGSGAFPKGWDKEDIWNDIGIKSWIEMLATGLIQPELGHPFENILKTPDLVVRSEGEIEEWLVSTRFQEEWICNSLDTIRDFKQDVEYDANQDSFTNLRNAIWKYFPKNTQSCHDYYGKDCQFVRHCHELESVEDMEAAGELIPRIPHHELEKQEFIEKGLIENE